MQSKQRANVNSGAPLSKRTDCEITSTLHDAQKGGKASTPMSANFLKKGQLSSPLEWMMDFQVDDEEIRSLDFAGKPQNKEENKKVNHGDDPGLQQRTQKHDGAKCRKRLAFQTPTASANSKRLKEQASKSIITPPHSPEQARGAEKEVSGSIQQHQQEKREGDGSGSDEVEGEMKPAHIAQGKAEAQKQSSSPSSPKELSNEGTHSATSDQSGSQRKDNLKPCATEDSQLPITEDKVLGEKEDGNKTDAGSGNGNMAALAPKDNLSKEAEDVNEKGSSEESLTLEVGVSSQPKSDVQVLKGRKESTQQIFEAPKDAKIHESLSSKEIQVRSVPLLTNNHSNTNAISVLGRNGKEDMSIVPAPKHFKSVSLSNTVDLKPFGSGVVPACSANIANEILDTIPKQMEGITETCRKIDAQNAHISKLKEHAEKVCTSRTFIHLLLGR